MPLAILPLPELISVMGAAGLVTGGLVSLFWPYDSDRDLAEHIVLGSGLGLVVGTAFAFAVGLVDAVAGA